MFRELLPLLVMKDLSLRVDGGLYAAYVKTAMMHISGIWAVTTEYIQRLERSEASLL